MEVVSYSTRVVSIDLLSKSNLPRRSARVQTIHNIRRNLSPTTVIWIWCYRHTYICSSIWYKCHFQWHELNDMMPYISIHQSINNTIPKDQQPTQFQTTRKSLLIHKYHPKKPSDKNNIWYNSDRNLNMPSNTQYRWLKTPYRGGGLGRCRPRVGVREDGG